MVNPHHMMVGDNSLYLAPGEDPTKRMFWFLYTPAEKLMLLAMAWKQIALKL